MNDQFFIAHTVEEIRRYLTEDRASATIFVDIDDTILIPVAKLFSCEPDRHFIEEIKAGRYPCNVAEIVSRWRLQRKVRLVDERWPRFLTELKVRQAVYGLTQIECGRFGTIESVEQWRSRELADLKIEFSQRADLPRNLEGASYYRGVFFTGGNTKSQVISHYQKYLNSSTIVMIDDKVEHLTEISHFCQLRGLHFTGILFQGVVPQSADPEIVRLQRAFLLKQGRWLEDEAAAAYLQPGK